MKKIVGYQVTNPISGDHWDNRPSFEILDQATAIADLEAARAATEGHYLLVAILEGDIDDPLFATNALTNILETPMADFFAGDCQCNHCWEEWAKTVKGIAPRPFIVCSNCGNKRCPKAAHHKFKCTGSDELDQVRELET